MASPERGLDVRRYESVSPRAYQIELVEKALADNSIVCLDTGTGKTLIAALVIKELSHELLLPYDDVKCRRSVFLVPEVCLVVQQAKAIAVNTGLAVGQYSGKTNTSNWRHDKWRDEIAKVHVLVMTPQIFVGVLQHAYMPLWKANIIVFDECHRVTGNHPYNMIMKKFDDCSKEKWPRVLGLSASLVNSKVLPKDVDAHILKLQNNMKSTRQSVSNPSSVAQFAAKPNEESHYFPASGAENEPLILDTTALLVKNMEQFKSFLSTLDDNQLKCVPRKVMKTFSTFMEIQESMSVYGAKELAGIYKQKFHSKADNYQYSDLSVYNVLLAAKSLMEWAETLWKSVLLPKSPKERLQCYVSPKMRALADVLLDRKSRDICAIVFVERRADAKVLSKWIQELAETDEDYAFVRAESVVGSGAGASMALMTAHKQEDVIKKFRTGEFNVLVATAVLGEGLDITQCNLIVMYDSPKTVKEYIQTKGRARQPGGKYVFLVQDSARIRHAHEQLLIQYRLAEKKIASPPENAQPKSASRNVKEIDKQPAFRPTRDEGAPKATMDNAIALLEGYCRKFPQDLFTNSKPIYEIEAISYKFFNTEAFDYTCTIKMPFNCPERTFKGVRHSKKLDAQKGAALDAIKKLHAIGEIDNNLLPTDKGLAILQELDFKSYDAIADGYDPNSGGPRPGTTKRRQFYKKGIADVLRGPAPVAGRDCFLYVFIVTAKNGSTGHQPKNESRTVGFISHEILPPLCQFPLFVRTGEVAILIAKDEVVIRLSPIQIEKVSRFHEYVFDDMLHTVKFPVSFNPLQANDSYFVVPIIISIDGPRIDWKFVDKVVGLKNESHQTFNCQNFVFDAKVYENAVVRKNYGSQAESFGLYFVKDIMTDITPTSKFPNEAKGYKSFQDYFSRRYEAQITNLTQPLLWVEPASVRLNHLLPRGKVTSQRYSDMEIYLVPELCEVDSLPAWFWSKAVLIPSILYRLNGLLLAEEIRDSVSQITKIGLIEGTNKSSFTWPPLTHDEFVKYSRSSMPKFEELDWSSDDIEDDYFATGPAPSTSSPKRPADSDWDADEPPQTRISGDVPNSVVPQVPVFGELHHNRLELLQSLTQKDLARNTSNLLTVFGPSPGVILQALTTSSAGDVLNLERLETIGDSYLKVSLTAFLFCNYRNHEGKLSELRSQLLSNLNLYWRGKKFGVADHMIASRFEPQQNWLPPGFVLPQALEDALVMSGVNGDSFDLRALQNLPLDIMSASQIVSSLSATRIAASSDSNAGVGYRLRTKQAVADKSVADSVEALIGAYLLCSGAGGALAFMRAIGIFKIPQYNDDGPPGADDPVKRWLPLSRPPLLPDYDSMTDKQIEQEGGVEGVEKLKREQLDRLENLYTESKLSEFERTIGYTFKNRAYLVQAFTHSSFLSNCITDCYQRLEFLGDAVLDFLITQHIYSDEKMHSPGALTDLRTALVNNALFAAFAVHYQFDKYLKRQSPDLSRVINEFASKCSRGPAQLQVSVIDTSEGPEEVILLQDVEVPKTLGDIFESVAGAIYLDSGMSLDKVWEVYYRMMKPEIDYYSVNVPKSPVAELYERYPLCVTFEDPVANPKLQSYDVCVCVKGAKYHGLGRNRKSAKAAAARAALKVLIASDPKRNM